jgi:hypothetical protein
MIQRNLRLAVAGGLLVALVGCDSNPDGPKAPTSPKPGAAVEPAKASPGVMPAKGKTRTKSAPPTAEP